MNKRTDIRKKRLYKLFAFFSSSSTTSSSYSEIEEWEKRKQQMLAVGIAMTAMLVYAFKIGLIKFDLVKTDIEYVEK